MKPKLLLSLLLVYGILGVWRGSPALQIFKVPAAAAPAAQRLLVKSRPHTALAATLQHSLAARYAGRITASHYDRALGCTLVETASGIDLAVLKRDLESEAWVAAVAVDALARACAKTPNDQFFARQYALKNTGQVIDDSTNYSGKSGADIQAEAAWDYTTGSADMVVAVIDSGVNFNHEDLKTRQAPYGYNFVEDSEDISDTVGHGTMSASVIAADSNNQIGVAGVCWLGKIMALKALTKQDNGQVAGRYSDIAHAIRYAADRGVRVIFIGAAGSEDNFILSDACQYANQKGSVLIAPAGNDGGAVQYPAAYDDYCLAVSASDASDVIWPSSGHGPQIDVCAPGVSIFAAAVDPQNLANNRYYAYGTGTSLAAAHVAGAVALLLAQKPFLLNSEAMLMIRLTADDVNSDARPGKDDYMGYGRINLQTLLGPVVLQ
jgi:thermitase